MPDADFQFATIRGGVSLYERVYKSIKDAILSLKLRPGSPLVEDELARQLGTSKTPVRDALLALERDGLVVKVPYKGTHVAELTPADTIEIFELRSVLEGLAGRLATHAITATDLEEAERLLDAADAARMRGDLAEASALGEKFHRVIIRRAPNRRLGPILENLDSQMRRLRLLSNRFAGRLEVSAREHRAILAALRSGDPAQVEQALRGHLESVLRDLLADDSANGSRPVGLKELA
jgi:DNA-binding GntR family transcriptional regulator